MRAIYLWLKSKKILLIIGLVVIFVTIAGGFIFKYLKSNSIPKIIIWAWERPENLLFINDKNIGVAFLAGSIIFKDSKITIKPRLQPLLINREIPMIPVIRIDNLDKNNQLQLSDDQFSEVLEFIIKTCSQNKIAGCQLDFDAKISERDFYKKLIIKVRNGIPKSIPLSITALASWCDINSWLDDLPIDEAIPMFFRLGTDEYLIRNNLVGESFMKAKICQNSIGISIDEPLPPSKYLKNRKIYIFNPHPWTHEDFSNILKEVERKLIKQDKINK